ncbi:ABC transporter permease [Chengkuizengella axinellae]|uniref:ABC transporter permease n=1 Tax=Chengkuizengella axinellae TaxID=3064388 RepID=A0ABT9J895_9BACL|nr:ABC transporter permease [Chengkuizengella sp. 2205SS18-9]MDP5277215.1 ABC transporter permease [Chengkuizengella sp. 2205SS18-9]
MIWTIYKKELIDSLRDRKTIMLSILIPMLFSLGMVFFYEAFFFNDSPEKYTVAVENTMDDETYTWFSQLDSLTVSKVTDPIQTVKDGEATIALYAEVDFLDKIEQGGSPTIDIYVDQFSQKGEQATSTLNTHLNTFKEAVQQKRYENFNLDAEVFEPFQFSINSISESEEDASSFLLSILAPLIIVMSIITAGIPTSNDIFAGEKERNTMEALLMTPVKGTSILFGKWLTVSTLSTFSGILATVMFVVTTKFFTEGLTNVIPDDKVVSFIGVMSIGVLAFGSLVSSIMMMLSLLANTVKEAGNYTSPLSILWMIPFLLLMGVSVNELTTTHFLIPFFNIFALIKQLIFGVYSIESIGMVVGSSILVIAILFLLGSFMFKKDRWVLGKGA